MRSINISECKHPHRGRREAVMGSNKQPKDKVTVQLDKFIRMEANNCSREDKLKEVFGVDINTASAREINNCDATMSRWRKHPMYDSIWKDELSRQDYSDYSKAREVLRKSMKSSDGWLAMNSAIQVINNGNKRLFNEDNNKVTVEITGMPEIGSPDDDE